MVEETVLLERAMTATAEVLRQVRPDDHGKPAPSCPDWDVRTLINHLVAGNRYFSAHAAGQQPDSSLWSVDHLGDTDPIGLYQDTAKTALEAWRVPGATEHTFTLPSGDQGPRLFDMHVMESYLHGWDLATAIGADRTLDEGVARSIYDSVHGRLPAEARADNVFGPEVTCPADAPVGDRLAAYLGRRP